MSDIKDLLAKAARRTHDTDESMSVMDKGNTHFVDSIMYEAAKTIETLENLIAGDKDSEERHAWDLYMAAAFDDTKSAKSSAEWADMALEQRRKRWHK